MYAIMTRFPFGSQLLSLVDYDPTLRASLLGSDAPLAVRNHGGKTEIVFPAIDPETVDSQWLYTVKLERESE